MELFELFGQIYNPHQPYESDDPTNEKSDLKQLEVIPLSREETKKIADNLPF